VSDDHGWGAKFLRRCGVDPDDPADVRAAYEGAREAYGRWLAGHGGEIDDETYYTLVDAIKDLYGWAMFPYDWPAPTLVLLNQPLRNLLPRKPAGSA
jgi:hypothetical protein